jgi:hypothetical protein
MPEGSEPADVTAAPIGPVPIDQVPEHLRRYLTRGELRCGVVDPDVLIDRRRTAEGRALAELRTRGQALPVRTTVDRGGLTLTTTEVIPEAVPTPGRDRA